MVNRCAFYDKSGLLSNINARLSELGYQDTLITR